MNLIHCHRIGSSFNGSLQILINHIKDVVLQKNLIRCRRTDLDLHVLIIQKKGVALYPVLRLRLFELLLARYSILCLWFYQLQLRLYQLLARLCDQLNSLRS